MHARCGGDLVSSDSLGYVNEHFQRYVSLRYKEAIGQLADQVERYRVFVWQLDALTQQAVFSSKEPVELW